MTKNMIHLSEICELSIKDLEAMAASTPPNPTLKFDHWSIPKQMESGRYRYVKIDLTDILHIDTGTAVYWKDISHSEVTPEPIGPRAGVCLPTMDINDTENYPKCTWPRWLAWLWKWFHPTKKWKLGPIRYFFIFEGNKQ